jgi:hypothetical protein
VGLENPGGFWFGFLAVNSGTPKFGYTGLPPFMMMMMMVCRLYYPGNKKLESSPTPYLSMASVSSPMNTMYTFRRRALEHCSRCNSTVVWYIEHPLVVPGFRRCCSCTFPKHYDIEDFTETNWKIIYIPALLRRLQRLRKHGHQRYSFHVGQTWAFR